MFNTAIFDESTWQAVIDSSAIEWLRQSYLEQGEWLLPMHVPDVWRLPPWTGQVRLEPVLLRRSVHDDRRVGLIPYLKDLWRRLLVSTPDLIRHTEPCLGDGIRLPLPQTLRRGNRMAHEPLSGSENGGDDD